MLPACVKSDKESPQEATLTTRALARTLAESLDASVLLANFAADGFPVWGAAARLSARGWSEALSQDHAHDLLEGHRLHPSEIENALERARSEYSVTFADLNGASPSIAAEVLRHADSVFLVSATDHGSLEVASCKAEWLHSFNLEDKTGLLLCKRSGGAGPAEFEERTGLPVCAFIDGKAGIRRVAEWIAAEFRNQKSQEALAS